MFKHSKYTQRHAFHLVDPSAMPIITSFSALTITIGAVMYFHGFFYGFLIMVIGMINTLICWFL
jgi:cytochrome c oxidase subunit 3